MPKAVSVPSSTVTLARGAPQRLKAERIQRFQKEHPEWDFSNDGKSLTRRFHLVSSSAAAAFVAWVVQTAGPLSAQPTIECQGSWVRVEITARGRALNQKDLEFARALSLSLSEGRRAA